MPLLVQCLCKGISSRLVNAMAGGSIVGSCRLTPTSLNFCWMGVACLSTVHVIPWSTACSLVLSIFWSASVSSCRVCVCVCEWLVFTHWVVFLLSQCADSIVWSRVQMTTVRDQIQSKGQFQCCQNCLICAKITGIFLQKLTIMSIPVEAQQDANMQSMGVKS